jgi:hypothetical protein
MDVRRYWFEQLIPAMVVDVVEALSDQFLYDVTVYHQTSLGLSLSRLRILPQSPVHGAYWVSAAT